MSTLGEVVVAIKGDTAHLNGKMREAVDLTRQNTQKMQQSIENVNATARALAATFATVFSVSTFKGIVDGVDRMNDLANQLGVTTEALSALEYAAKLSGTSLEQVAMGMKLLGNNVSDAAVGLGEAGNTLKALGIDAKSLAAQPLDKQFEQIADAMSKVGNQNDKIAMARDLFGRMGADLLPLINDFKDLKAEAQAVGYVVSSDMAQRFADLNDEIDRMGLASKTLGRNMAEVLVPALNDVIKGINELFAKAPNTSKFFNSLGVGMIGIGAKLGLVDQDVADAAADEAAANVASGEHHPLKVSVNKGSARAGKTAKAEKQKEAEDYDRASDALSELLGKYQQEAELAQLSGKALEVRRAEIEATAAAIKSDSLGTSQAMIDQIKEQAAVTYDAKEAAEQLKKSQDEAAQSAREWRQKLTDGLTDIVLHFDSATDAARKFFEEIAGMVLKQKVTGPLAESISSAIGGSDLFSGIGKFFGLSGARASGGPVSGGDSYLVGENGPEIFTPSMSGAIIPNHAIGGQQIVINHNWSFSSGVQREDLAAMIPSIVAMSRQATFDAIEKGGRASQLVGKRQ